jgi:hypothetical protein
VIGASWRSGPPCATGNLHHALALRTKQWHACGPIHSQRADFGQEQEGNAGMWENYVLAQRQLQITIAEEDYARAAQLRDQITELLDLLPPSKQILIALEAQLEVATTIDERAACVASLGKLGDPSALPVLAKHLRDEHLGDIVESAMWSTFLHPPGTSPDIQRSPCLALQRGGFMCAFV